MNKNPSVVEINGKRYDALTGQLIGAVKRVATSVSRSTSGATIDGFVRRKHAAPVKQRATNKTVKTTSSKEVQLNKPFSHGLRSAALGIHRSAQRSQTLMRSIVNKPGQSAKDEAKTSGQRKARVAAIDSSRLARAKATPKHQRVNRFGFSGSASNNNPTRGASQGELLPKQAATQQAAASTTAVARPLPSLLTSVSHRQLERLLDHALTNADAHKQALKLQLQGNGFWQRVARAPKWLTFSLAALVILIAGGVFVWQNMPSVAVRVAALRTHISASVPNYTPTGFKFAGLTDYHSGAVTIQYKANGDSSRTFAITQEKSNLDSSSLAATTMPSNSAVQSSQVNGKTVYIYGEGNNAAWVDNGMKYVISDHANLNADQILKIVDSLD